MESEASNNLRGKYYEELNELLNGPDVVKYIKFKRLQWAGHVVQMDSTSSSSSSYKALQPV
jgi:hypothetical protein